MPIFRSRFSEKEIKENIPVLPGGKTSHILVLYSFKNAEVGLGVINHLENHFAISCYYYDTTDVLPRMPYIDNIKIGLSQCLSVILLITKNFIGSQQCMFGTQLALQRQHASQSAISIIPVLLDKYTLPLELSVFHHIDAYRQNMTISDIAFDIAAAFVAPYLNQASEGDLDPLTQQIYEKAITEGREEDSTIRLMIVGCHGQGKTTLARRLLRQPLEGIESTNGIDIHRVVCTKDKNTWEHRNLSDIHKESTKRLASTKIPRIEEIKEKQADSDQLTAETVYQRRPTTAVATGNFQGDTLSASLEGPNVQTQSKKYSSSELKRFQEFRKELSSVGQKTTQISLWDFGGQFIFYATHQLFHSRNAVYLLVFDLHKELNSPVIDDDYPGETHAFVKSMKDYIEFWVSSVHSFVGSKDCTQPTIILIGTHKEELKDENTAEEYFEYVRKMFDGRNLRYHIYRECFAVSGTTDLTDDVIDRLRETIIKVGGENKQEIPARWIPLEMALKERQHVHIMTFENVVEINNSLPHPIEKEAEIKSFLKVHHARGTFIYFDDGEMAKSVIVNPPYIVDAFRCIISSGRFCRQENDLRPLWQKLCQHAILDPVLLQSVWGNDAVHEFVKYKDVLISVLKRNRIISEALKFDEISENLTPLGFFLVPSLLRKSTNGEIEKFLDGRNCTSVSLVYVFENEAVVPTVFNRVTAAASGSWPVVEVAGNNLLFEDAGIYSLKSSHAGLIIRVRNMIELLVVHMSLGKAVSPEKADYLRRFVEHVIGHEFRKLVNDETELQPFKTAVRCQHKLHNCKGSIATYDYETLKKESEKDLCCPDNVLHDCINVDSIRHEWFMLETRHKVIPKRRLSTKEYSTLSMAVGCLWQQLGRQLGIDHVTIQHIEMDYQRTSMRIYEMLLAWDSQQKEEATLDKLVEKVRILPPDTVNWDIVNNVIDNIF